MGFDGHICVGIPARHAYFVQGGAMFLFIPWLSSYVNQCMIACESVRLQYTLESTQDMSDVGALSGASKAGAVQGYR
jgi:hypothetical protein